MSTQDFGSESARQPRDRAEGKNTGAATGDAMSKVSDAARGAADTARQTASNAASTMTHQMKELLDRQVGTGAEMVGHFARSAKRVADDLDRESPQLAGLVRVFADRIDSYAHDLRDQSVDQLMRSASDFTRRQPALVFGAAALAGFFLFRTIKSAGPMPSPSIQPGRGSQHDEAGEFHGS